MDTTSFAPPSARTGIVGLDDVLGGGFAPHRLYLIEGTPGAGKTTLGLQFLLEGLRQGERGLYITLSETAAELRANAATHGWSLAGLEVFELSVADDLRSLDSQSLMFHASEVELGETMQTLFGAVEQHNPVRVVIDSLSELHLLSQSPLRYRRQILALKQFFAERQITVLLLDDLTTEVNDRQLESIAHGVVLLEHLSPEYGSERRRLRVTKFRGRAFRGGFHDFRIVRGGFAVFPRLIAAEHHQPFTIQQLASGVPELDGLLGGGLHYGTSTLLLGPAGAGKSSLATDYALAAAAQGEHATIFTFDESLAVFLTRSIGIGLAVQSYLDTGQLQLRQVDPAELAPGEFVHLVRAEVERVQARVVVIDSLNGYLNAMPGERFLLAQLHELLTYLGQRGVVTILVVGQNGLIGTTMDMPLDATYLADTVILLRYFEANGAVRRAISVVKKRSGPHEHTIREFHIDGGGVRLGAPLTAFQGVLTGVPRYIGEHDPLLNTELPQDG
ncbi:MAG TPA: ATPase domain-containing protein [Roseiflexaceae bacterium]|nr:ATPase domain-containing protein [Roseiflexaceae bacterium]